MKFYKLLTGMLMCCVVSVHAQVKGTVTNSSGEPLIGASIVWLGTSVGVVTDLDGHFTLEVHPRVSRLVASYVGHIPDTITIGQQPSELNIVLKDLALGEVLVTANVAGTRRIKGVTNSVAITQKELTRAACCNLGESFSTNPSVDVSYSDAATGARQIKMLGLSGAYVQMLTENIPAYRGVAAPYGLGYVPGTWLQSIEVSKGSASVKNGYESITGQINVEFKKPQDHPQWDINVYGDNDSRVEANVEGNIHLSKRLSTSLLTHYENTWGEHDDNGDGFLDKPKVRQYNVMNRWAFVNDDYILQAGIKALKETRRSGQTAHTTTQSAPLFGINIETQRYEAFAKNALILNHARETNIALILSGTFHDQDATFGRKVYDVIQKTGYASLMFETHLAKAHQVSVGTSWNYDRYNEDYRMTHDATQALIPSVQQESVLGAYAQYTFTPSDKLTVMGGLRVDRSNVYGTFVTPRAHIKFMPSEVFTLRASGGKGYRTVFALGQYNYLMASGRKLVIDDLEQEAAWNAGMSTDFNIPFLGRTLKLNAEYYYTKFSRQVLLDMDSNTEEFRITNLNGRSYSHTFQLEASYPLTDNFTMTAAYRWNDTKATYGGQLLERPLTGKYKGLVTASYKTRSHKWQVDATLQLNGGGRMPKAYTDASGKPSWDERYKGFEQLNLQVTRWLRHSAIYVGVENLTNFKQKNAVINGNNPWSERFDPTMIWGPVHGTMFYAGVRLNLRKH